MKGTFVKSNCEIEKIALIHFDLKIFTYTKNKNKLYFGWEEVENKAFINEPIIKASSPKDRLVQ